MVYSFVELLLCKWIKPSRTGDRSMRINALDKLRWNASALIGHVDESVENN